MRERGWHAEGRRLLVRLDDPDHVPRDGAADADDGAEPDGSRSAVPGRNPAARDAVSAGCSRGCWCRCLTRKMVLVMIMLVVDVLLDFLLYVGEDLSWL